MYDSYWEALRASLWAPETYLKVLILILTAPIWAPIGKVVWQEIRAGLAPDGTLWKRDGREPPRHAPGMDPFTNIPLAKERRRLSAPPEPNDVLTPAPRSSGPTGSRARSTGARRAGHQAAQAQGRVLGRVPARRRGFQ